VAFLERERQRNERKALLGTRSAQREPESEREREREDREFNNQSWNFEGFFTGPPNSNTASFSLVPKKGTTEEANLLMTHEFK